MDVEEMGTGQENRITEALKFQDVNHTLTLSTLEINLKLANVWCRLTSCRTNEKRHLAIRLIWNRRDPK